jgi:hypothetical protein
MPTAGGTTNSWIYNHITTRDMDAHRNPTHGRSGISSLGVASKFEAFKRPMIFPLISGFVPHSGPNDTLSYRIAPRYNENYTQWNAVPYYAGMMPRGISGYLLDASDQLSSGVSDLEAGFYLNSGISTSGNTIYNQYVWGHPSEIPNLRHLEVINGTDLSALTVQAIVIGR